MEVVEGVFVVLVVVVPRSSAGVVEIGVWGCGGVYTLGCVYVCSMETLIKGVTPSVCLFCCCCC